MAKLRMAVTALTVTVAGLAGTKLYEGKHNAAYVERVAGNQVVTVCYGHTATAVIGQRYTDTQCDALLLQDLNEVYAPAVRRLVKVPLTQGEFNALTDFAYNVGVGNLANSTLLKLTNQGRYTEACKQYPKWSYVNGKDCNNPANLCGGIPKRRAWQQSMCES